MNSPLDFSTVSRLPTIDRPLAGQHILVVEDSYYACEALRQLCLRSGARIRRADCLSSGRRHLATYRPGVLIVDLGLPDGSGIDLIREAANAVPPIAVIVAISGDPDREAEALAAGAHVFMEKPLKLIDKFQTEILALLPGEARPEGLKLMHGEAVRPDTIALVDDLARAADAIADAEDGETLDYVLNFLAGVARSAEDGEMRAATDAVVDCRREGRSYHSQLANLSALVQDRLVSNRQVI